MHIFSVGIYEVIKKYFAKNIEILIITISIIKLDKKLDFVFSFVLASHFLHFKKIYIFNKNLKLKLTHHKLLMHGNLFGMMIKTKQIISDFPLLNVL